MPLTVREKDHWRDRIARRIDHAIEELQAKEDPGFHKRVGEEAEKAAWASLGLDALHTEDRRVEDDIKRLTDRQSEIWQEMESIVKGKPVAECNSAKYIAQHSVRSAVDRRAKVHQKELMQASPIGQKILQLLHEKDELLDTVWLASSPSQIKELWSRFAEVLNWEPPQLQRKALEIPPVSDNS